MSAKSNRPRRSRVPAAGVGLAVSVAAVVVPSEPAAAVNVPVWHWNMKGGCSGTSELPTTDDGNCGGLEASNFLVNGITYASPRPWHVTLNEVCSRQMNSLDPYMRSLGYLPYWIPTNTSSTVDSRCGQHGMAIFTLGSELGYSSSVFTQANPAEGDMRKAFCVSANTIVGPRKTCEAPRDR